jgi:hypothetical protein
MFKMTFRLIELPKPTESEFTDYAVAAMEDRSSPRYRFAISAQLRPSGVTGFAVVVTNLSLSGFACDAVTGIPPGARCWLTLPGLAPLQAEVIHNNGQVVGCAFSNLLSQVILDNIAARHGIALPDYW